jgi:hypothetical protein
LANVSALSPPKKYWKCQRSWYELCYMISAYQITHEDPRSAALKVIERDAEVLAVGIHVEYDGAQRRRLSHRPVDAADGCPAVDGCNIDLEVADRLVEVQLGMVVVPPGFAVVREREAVHDHIRTEVRGCFQRGPIDGVAGELGIHAHLQCLRDNVYARREVH